MKKAKITFLFSFNDGSSMETTHEGQGVTKDDAEAKAWQAMAADCFKKQLILKTTSITLGKTEFMSSPVS